jgi:hypothetical protein
MPTKQRTADYRRAQSNRNRRREPAAEQAQRVPKSKAYDRNKRASSKVSVRNAAWQDW